MEIRRDFRFTFTGFSKVLYVLVCISGLSFTSFSGVYINVCAFEV